LIQPSGVEAIGVKTLSGAMVETALVEFGPGLASAAAPQKVPVPGVQNA